MWESGIERSEERLLSLKEEQATDLRKMVKNELQSVRG